MLKVGTLKSQIFYNFNILKTFWPEYNWQVKYSIVYHVSKIIGPTLLLYLSRMGWPKASKTHVKSFFCKANFNFHYKRRVTDAVLNYSTKRHEIPRLSAVKIKRTRHSNTLEWGQVWWNDTSFWLQQKDITEQTVKTGSDGCSLFHMRSIPLWIALIRCL